MKKVIGLCCILFIPSTLFSGESISKKNMIGLWKAEKDKSCIAKLLREVAKEEKVKLDKAQFDAQVKAMMKLEIEYNFQSGQRGEARLKMPSGPDLSKLKVYKFKIKYVLKEKLLKLYVASTPSKEMDTLKIVSMNKDQIVIKDGPCQYPLIKISSFSIH